MNLPPDFEFHETIHLLIYRPRGVLNRESVNEILKVIAELEGTLTEPFNRFWDATHYEKVDLDFQFTTEVSLSRRREVAGRPSFKSAFLASDPRVTHYAKLLAVLTQGSPIKIRIFESREEAAKWLEVPLEVLAPKMTTDQGQE